MPHIIESYFNSVTQRNLLSVIYRCQKLRCGICVCNRINRFVFRFSASSCLPVSPFRFKFLNMCAVTKHNITKIRRCKCGDDLPGKSFFHQKRNISGMINMCMCQKNVIYISRCNRKFLILVNPPSRQYCPNAYMCLHLASVRSCVFHCHRLATASIGIVVHSYHLAPFSVASTSSCLALMSMPLCICCLLLSIGS